MGGCLCGGWIVCGFNFFNFWAWGSRMRLMSAQKWLKDRKGRKLTNSDIEHWLIVFLSSAIFLGLYYGFNNYRIYHLSEIAGISEPKLKTISLIDNLWKHLISALAGSVALYLLSMDLFSGYLNFYHFVLSVVGLLEYAGLLPMTLWFFARSGDVLANMIKR